MDSYDDLFDNPLWDCYHPHHLTPEDRAFDAECKLYSTSEWKELFDRAGAEHATLGGTTVLQADHSLGLWFLIYDNGRVAAAFGETPPATASTDWQAHGNHEALMLARNLLDVIQGVTS
jgi:hypothetical protein